MFVDVSKATAEGLTFRPLSDTICDTLKWFRAERTGTEMSAGLEPAKEAAILTKWHSTTV